MIVPAKPLHEITRNAIHVLSREMGAVDTMRFLNQFGTGSGNYTEERESIFGQLDLDEILLAVRKDPEQK